MIPDYENIIDQHLGRDTELFVTGMRLGVRTAELSSQLCQTLPSLHLCKWSASNYIPSNSTCCSESFPSASLENSKIHLTPTSHWTSGLQWKCLERFLYTSLKFTAWFLCTLPFPLPAGRTTILQCSHQEKIIHLRPTWVANTEFYPLILEQERSRKIESCLYNREFEQQSHSNCIPNSAVPCPLL